MAEKFTKEYIKQRIEVMEKNTRRPRKGNIIRNLAYEFGVNQRKYNPRATTEELVDTTYHNQTFPSQLDKDIQNELSQFL